MAQAQGSAMTGRLIEAEEALSRALAIRERELGGDHPATLATITRLALIQERLGQLREAERLHGRALDARTRLLGPEHPHTLGSLNALASLYDRQRRLPEAERLFLIALQACERRVGPGHPATLTVASNLAYNYISQGRHAEAEPLFRRVLDSRERALGAEHRSTVDALIGLAELYRIQNRLAEAEPLARRAFETSERADGADHPRTLAAAREFAQSLRGQGRYAEALPLFRRAYEVRQRVLGPAQPLSLSSAAYYVQAMLEQPAEADVMAPARRLLEGTRQRRDVDDAGQDSRSRREREGTLAAASFTLFADAAWTTSVRDPAQREALTAASFEALQEAISGAADRAVAEQAARRFVGGRDPALPEAMAERRRLEEQWSRLDGDLAASFGASEGQGGPSPSDVRTRLDAVQARIEAVDARLRIDAPEYFALIAPTPIDIPAAQALLAANEAMLLAVPGRFGTHVVAVTQMGATWHRSDWTADRIGEAVRRLRWDLGARVEASEAELARLRRPDGDSGRQRFDRTAAHDLYQQLVGPIATALTGKTRIYVAAGGPLSALPFSVLVSASPDGDDGDPAALRATRWFGDDFGLIHVPSLQSLATLRRAPRPSRRRASFIGFGDPVLSGQAVSRGFASSRSGSVNVRVLRSLARLPGTAAELERMGSALGAGPESLFLGERATERLVRGTDLTRARVLAFATHGLVAGEAAGVTEAGLVLSPPAAASQDDDGFLAASEVAGLRLDADWVVLSACNTATSDRGSQGLGSLARSFLYAGARNLLASHWPVSDAVAPVLTVRTLELERGGLNRAEAFRRAMHEIRMDASHDTDRTSWAHPFYWAPFVLVGDGS